MAVKEVEDLAPPAHRLLRPIGLAQRIEEGVAGAIVTVKFVILAELLEYYLGAIDLVGGRIGTLAGAKLSPIMRMICRPTITVGNFVPTISGNWCLLIVW